MAISFFKNKRAVAGLVIVVLIMFFAIFGPMMNSYSYKDIISVTSAEGKQIVAKGIGPIITQVMFFIPTAIFTEAFLSFVGVGIVLPECSIGSLIEAGFNFCFPLPRA